MSDRLTERLAELERLASSRGWRVLERREIEHGMQCIVTDGTVQLPVNVYHTGKVLVAASVAKEYGFTDIDGTSPRPLTIDDV